MPKHPFLSDDWITELRKIQAETKGKVAAPPHSVKMNLVVTGVPSQEEAVDIHLDSTGGEFDFELGHLEDPDVTVTLDYAVAKAVFVDGNPQAGMQASMQGTVEVDGDLAKLMETQQPGALNDEGVAERIRAMTE